MNISKHKLFYIILVIFLGFISYGQTLQMYFWRDDAALIFKLQHPEGPAGSWGSGLLERGPYRYAVAIFAPFFPLFGLEPFWYFATGLLIYLVSAGIFYLFAARLLQNRKAAYISTLVFGAGFIGSDSMFLVANSWHNNIGIIFALLSFWAYVRYLKEGGLKNYFLSLGIFLATIELIFIRSHSLIFAILGLDLLFKIFPFSFGKLFRLIVRQAPFFLLFRIWYLQEASTTAIDIGKVTHLAPFLADIGNGLVPDVIQTKIISFLTQVFFSGQSLDMQLLWLHLLIVVVSIFVVMFLMNKFLVSIRLKIIVLVLLIFTTALNLFFYKQGALWYQDVQSIIAGLVGLHAWIIIPLLSTLLWKTQKNLAVALLFGLIVITSQIFGYYIKYPEVIFSSTHRYFTYSFIGYSILLGTLLYLLMEAIKDRFKMRGWQQVFIFAPLLVVGVNLFLGITYQHKIVKEISTPTRRFYQDLKRMVPRILPGSIFYFDVARENSLQRQFSNFFSVGSMPNSTAIAIYYALDRDDVILVENFDELIFKLASNSSDIDKVYTFFYTVEGLINTTDDTRRLLKAGSEFAKISDAATQRSTAGDNIEILLITSGIATATPLLVDLRLKIKSLTYPAIFPYQQQGVSEKDLTLADKNKFLQCLSETKSFYQTAQASSVSDWKYREVRNVVDQNSETVWQGSRIWWHDYQNETLTINLNKVKTISRVVWQNWRPELAPMAYTIQTSSDGSSWEDISVVKNGPERKGDELVYVDFDPREARFIRMRISQTLADDAPALEEFMVLGPDCQDVDLERARLFYQTPFGYVKNEQEWDLLYQKLSDIFQARVQWSTDKDKNVLNRVDFPAYLDGGEHSYQIIIPAGGRQMRDLNIVINIPVEIEVVEARIRNLSFLEIKERGLIKQFNK